jgi:hypothetical protein
MDLWNDWLGVALLWLAFMTVCSVYVVRIAMFVYRARLAERCYRLRLAAWRGAAAREANRPEYGNG